MIKTVLTIVISFTAGCLLTYVLGMRIWLVHQVGHMTNDIHNDLAHIEHLEGNRSVNVAQLVKKKLACESALLAHLASLPLAPEASGLTARVLAESKEYQNSCETDFSA